MANDDIIECCVGKLAKRDAIEKAPAERQCKDSLASMSKYKKVDKITCFGIASDAEYKLGLVDTSWI
jgi:hypothetical protein